MGGDELSFRDKVAAFFTKLPAPDSAPSGMEDEAAPAATETPAIIPVPDSELVGVKLIQREMLEARKKLATVLLEKSMEEHELHTELDTLEDGLADELDRLRGMHGAPEDYLLSMPPKRGENGHLVRPDTTSQSE